jgi:hypothetical protein
MKYRVLTASTPQELEQVVQLHISEGWEPLGGVSVTTWVEPEALPAEDETEYVTEIDEETEPLPAPDYCVYTQYTQAVVHPDESAK